MSLTKAAVVQADTLRTVEKLAELTPEACRGAHLVVFPKAFKGLDFGTRLGSRSPEGRVEFQRYFDSAIDLPSAEAVQIGEVVRDNGVHLVVDARSKSAVTFDNPHTQSFSGKVDATPSQESSPCSA